MNKFVTSALAITAAGSLAYAGTGDSEWLELDREITTLSSSLTAADQHDGMGWSALLRVTTTYSDDDIATGDSPATPAGDVFGWSFEDVDLAFWGQVGDYGWRISMDASDNSKLGGDFNIEDAHAWWSCGEYATALIGQHKANTLESSHMAPEGLFFINRTALGSAFDGWDNGISAWGELEMIRWSASIQNSLNGQEGDHRYTVRVEYDLGEGAGDVEGALGAGDDFAATVGLVYIDDDGQDLSLPITVGSDNEAYGLDFRGTAGPVGFGAEIMSIGDDLALGIDEDFSRIAGFGNPLLAVATFAEDTTQVGGATPYSVMVTYLLNEEFEFGVRYEDLDNVADTTIISVGIAWYQSGHNAKWQAGWSDIDNDSILGVSTPDGSIWQIGLTVGASGG